MKVSELISFLQKQQQDIQVVYTCYSEYSILYEHELEIAELCIPRVDSWVHEKRPDKPSQTYLVFPGN